MGLSRLLEHGMSVSPLISWLRGLQGDKIYIYIYIYIGEVVAGRSLLRYVSSLMYFTWIISSLCIDELFLHMVENISLTYAKVSCSLVMIDSSFHRVMKMCTIQRLP
jgi:hypothetical protein